MPAPGKVAVAAGKKSGDRWQGKCAARLEKARLEAAKREPLFLMAKVDEVTREYAEPDNPDAKNTIDMVELRFDENSIDKKGPLYFAAEVQPRTHKWSADDSMTSWAWSGEHGVERNISIYRQTSGFEGSIASFNMGRLIPVDSLHKLVDAVFKPAVDDCLRLGGK